MASQKDIRRRIQSIKNTSQITRAMKMVAAAKLRRAQENILNARPYAYRIYSLLLALAEEQKIKHPLLVERPERKVRAVLLSGDRGLCGSFNMNIFKAAEQLFKEKEESQIQVTLDCIGKKGYEYFKRRREVTTYHEDVLVRGSYSQAGEIAQEVIQRYLDEEFDSIYLIYNEFKSAIQQKPVVERFVPISVKPPDGVVGVRHRSKVDGAIDYLLEPTTDKLVEGLVNRHFQTQLYRSVCESMASEHGARMSAMESATQNADELVDKLTLDYNKARQASITRELTEIVGGMEAL